MTPRITIIAAMTWRERILSVDGKIPWHPIKVDMDHFRLYTMYKPIIMGRKTYEAIGKPLCNRHNIVLTRNISDMLLDAKYEHGVDIAYSRQQAIELAVPAKEVMIIGGAEIYALFLPFANVMRLSLLYDEYEEEGHEITKFPRYSNKDWELVDMHNNRDQAIIFSTYKRRK